MNTITLIDAVRRRTAGQLSPALANAVAELAAAEIPAILRQPTIARLFPALKAALAPEPAALEPFQAAWLLMYAAISRLDDLQDGAAPTTAHALPLQYTLTLATYVAATAMLDDLPATLPLARRMGLMRLWNDQMLAMAAGQHQDLVGAAGVADLPAYERLAAQKTGATFGLACAGVACLCRDDEAQIALWGLIGAALGILVQCGDDILDIAEDAGRAGVTLPRAVQHQLQMPGAALTAGHYAAVYERLRWSYREHIRTQLAAHPAWASQAAALLELFAEAPAGAPS